jgi:hypothetical protein
MADMFCPLHGTVIADLQAIKSKQEARHCQGHEVMIAGLDVDLTRVEKDNTEQWVAINQLRRLVYMGAGGVIVASFVGAMLGNLLMGFIKR